MKTRCPGCQTTFRVTPEQLKARAGKVRCGQCQMVFNALDSLVEEVQISSPSPEIDHEALVAPPHTETNGAASFTDIQEFEEAPQQEERFRSPDADTADNTEPDPALSILLEPTVAPVATSSEPDQGTRREPSEQAIEPLSEAEAQELGKATGLILPREMTEVPGYSKWSAGVMAASLDHAPDTPARWPYVLVATLLTVALAGQVAFRFRSELAITVPALRLPLESISKAMGTTVPLPRHVDLVSIESSDLQSDAARGNLLVLNATVRNRAAYAQAYPALELALTDTQDTPIARRIFKPEEYLPSSLRADQPFPAHSDVGVRLWIEAKDISAAGYRLYVFYP